MEIERNTTLALAAAVVSIAACGVAVFCTRSAYVSPMDDEKPVGREMRELQQNVTILDTRCAALSNTLAHLEKEFARLARPAARGTAMTDGKAGQRIDGTLAALCDSLMRIEGVVDSTGLDALTTNENVDPSVLQEVYDDYVQRRRLTEYHDRMREANTQLHNADREKYDTAVRELYNRARSRGRRNRNNAERDKAFEEMVADYPEANATGMLLAERAIRASFRGETAELEKYYDLIQKNEDPASIVTDRGMRAMPTIEYYLARRYVNEGRYDDARPLIESLEQEFPGSFLFVIQPGSRPRWQPASTAATRLLGATGRQR